VVLLLVVVDPSQRLPACFENDFLAPRGNPHAKEGRRAGAAWRERGRGCRGQGVDHNKALGKAVVSEGGRARVLREGVVNLIGVLLTAVPAAAAAAAAGGGGAGDTAEAPAAACGACC
jgi:hypothetical protein